MFFQTRSSWFISTTAVLERAFHGFKLCWCQVLGTHGAAIQALPSLEGVLGQIAISLTFCCHLSLELCDVKLILHVPEPVILLPPDLVSSNHCEKSPVQFDSLTSLSQAIPPTAAAPNSPTTALCLRDWHFVCFIYKSCWWKHLCSWTQQEPDTLIVTSCLLCKLLTNLQ